MFATDEKLIALRREGDLLYTQKTKNYWLQENIKIDEKLIDIEALILVRVKILFTADRKPWPR